MPEKPPNDKSLAGAIEKEVNTPNKQEEKKQITSPPKKDPEKKEPDKTASEPNDEGDKSRDGEIDASLRDPSKRATELDASESTPKDAAQAAEDAETARRTKPLETVLQMGPPTEEKAEDHKAPHLQAPPYVHHFDTFSLVKDLEGGGFSEDQSVTIMKAIRGLLALNLDVAKEGLVSKSDVENVRRHPPLLTKINPLPTQPHTHPYNTNNDNNRKHTSSAPPVPNSAPKSSTPANPPPPKPTPSSPTSNTPPTSSPNAPRKKPKPSKTT